MGGEVEGYQNLGSFHSENVDDLATAPDEIYHAPALPFPDPATDILGAASQPVPVLHDLESAEDRDAAAREFRERHFDIDRDMVFVNHGAFGSACRAASKTAMAWRARAAGDPVRFVDRECLDHWAFAARRLSRFMGLSDARRLALCQNATSALNASVRMAAKLALQREMAEADTRKGQRDVLVLEWAYGSVKVMAEEIFKDRFLGRDGPEPRLIKVPMPAGAEYGENGDGVVAALERYLDDAADTVPGTAIVDHVFSNTGAVCPLARVVALLRARGVGTVIVDGAHGPLQLGVDLNAIGADTYCANLHKWVCAAPGAAFVHLGTDAAAAAFAPATVSHGYRGGLHSACAWDGTRDYAGQLSVTAALRFIDAIGGPDAVRRRIAATLDDAIAALTSAWGTDTLVPRGNYASMATVRVPGTVVGGDASSDDAKRLQDALFHTHAIECPVKAIRGALFVRISAHIYNVRSDYATLARAVLAEGGA